MNNFIRVLLSLSASGTFMALILIILKPLYKKKTSQKWQYYIWIVVILRLLLPVTINFNITENIYSKLYSSFTTFKTESNKGQMDNNFPETLLTEKETAQKNGLAGNTQKINTIYSEKNINGSENKQFNVQELFNKLHVFSSNNIFYIWLIVTIVLITRKITVYQSFNNYLKAGAFETNSLNILEQTGILVQKYNIKPKVGIYINNVVSSPLLTGFFTPCIILPSEKLEEKDLHNIINHELIHFKRKDMLYKWLVQFTACIHWFNPFIYLIIHETNKLCELSCDEAVIKDLGSRERREYGNTLLNMADSKRILKKPGTSVTLNESLKLLKERLDKIMEFKKKTISCTIISAVLALSLCVTAAATGTSVINKADRKSQLIKDNIYNNLTDMNNRSASRNRKDKQYNAIKKHIAEGKVIFEEGTYHILCNGVSEKDMSSGGCSDGCISITLDQPDGYVAFGGVSLKNIDNIVDETISSCKYYLKDKSITQKEADLMIGLARLLKDDNGKIDGVIDISISREYKKWKINRKDGNFYYNKKRVRILADFRADKSLVQFSYDENGIIDLKITRNKKGNISKVRLFSEKEAEKLLEDWR